MVPDYSSAWTLPMDEILAENFYRPSPAAERLRSARPEAGSGPVFPNAHGPLRLFNPIMEAGMASAGVGATSFLSSLLGKSGGTAAADWMARTPEIQQLMSHVPEASEALLGAMRAGPKGPLQIGKDALAAGVRGAKSHFEIHSPFAWAASAESFTLQTAGRTMMGVAGLTAGLALKGAAVAGLWAGGKLAIGAAEAAGMWTANIENLADRLSPIANRALGSIPTLGNRLGQMGTNVLNSVAQKVAPEAATNVIEAATGYGLKKGLRKGLGRAIGYGLPLAGLAWGALTVHGKMDQEHLKYQQGAPVSGGMYNPRRPIDNLGASGDLVMALHALR
jgi:hypothetical protein